MKRSITLLTLLVLVVVSYGLYNLKYEVEDLQEHADRLHAQMDEDRRAIKVLNAEWAYLSRPDRLERLSSRFLTLQPTLADQVGKVSDLRLKPMDGLEAAPPPVVDANEKRLPLVEQRQSAEAPAQATPMLDDDAPEEDVQ